jgi:hypothetical protein
VPLSLPTNAEDRVLRRSGEPRHFREGSDLARQRCSLVGPDGVRRGTAVMLRTWHGCAISYDREFLLLNICRFDFLIILILVLFKIKFII